MFAGKITLDDADKDQSDLIEKKMLKRHAIDSINSIYESREMFLNAFRIGMFSFQLTEGTGHSGMLSHTALIT